MTEQNDNESMGYKANYSEQDDDSSEITKNIYSVGFSDGSADGFRWYVAHALSGQENKVAKSLRERVLNAKLQDKFSDILIPEESVTSHSGGKKRTYKKKFFPGYILIKMIMDDSTWHLVQSTDKITGFLGGTSGRPTPLSDEEAEYMTGQGGKGIRKSQSKGNFSEGDSVKVIEGPFASFVGTIESVSDKGKIKVSVSIFGRPTPVELDFSQVEKVG